MTERPNVDVLSEVLRAVRLRGAVFFNVCARAPWVAEAADGRTLAPIVLPGAQQVIAYHIVTATSGGCFASLPGGASVAMAPGDIVVFPHGHSHTMASSAHGRGAPDFSLYQHALDVGLPAPIELGDVGRADAPRSDVVCGFLACDTEPFNPLLAALPPMMHVKKRSGGYGEMLEYFTSTVLAESREHRSGGAAVIARLSELMFVEVVREYVASLPPEQTGWIAGLRDEVVGRALGALHGDPKKEWTLESLARHAGASRSALADRFPAHVGVPPMQYLAQWRMQLASSLLAGPATLAQIASDVGYGSEAAFSRAFKKIVGVPPATWRARVTA